MPHVPKALLALLALVPVLVACSMPSPLGVRAPNERTGAVGNLAITAYSPGVSLAELQPTATLENNGMSRPVPLTLTEDGLVGEVTSLPIGDWVFSLELRDATGDLTHAAVETVRVYANVESVLEIQVAPIDATLEIVANFNDFPERDRVKKVRVSFGNGGTLTLDPSEDELYVFHGVKKLSSGDYEYSIGAYGESFYASDRLYESPWEGVRLESGKTTQVQWNTALGSASLRAEIVQMPLTPQGLQCAIHDEGILLTWEPSASTNVAGYQVYTRSDEYDHYKEDVYVEAPSATALLTTPKVETSVRVTSVDSLGRESFRSEPIVVPTSCG